MKRDGRGGTEVSVKITCDEERRWFEKGAYVAKCGKKEEERNGMIEVGAAIT